MKSKKQKTPKTHLKKYAGGGTTNYNEFGYNPEQSTGTSNIYNDKRSSKISSDQYAQAGAAIGAGGIQAYQGYSDPYANDLQKTRSIQAGADTAKTGVATAINPLLGIAVGAVTKIGSGIQSNVDRTDANGNIINKGDSKFGEVVGGFASPSNSLIGIYTDPNATTGQKVAGALTGGLSDMFTNRHKNQVESNAKKNLFAGGGMNMQPNAIPQYPNGGKIPNLKPRDFKAEKAHYEEQTRGANQADGSGISSAELAYRYSKLIDPTGATSAVEIGKNFYNGNPQDPIDYLGLVKIPFVSQGMKPLSKLAKQGNKASVLINTITKTNDVAESFRAGGSMGVFAMGGMNMQPNAEVEKQENTLNPDGSTTQFDGSSHEQGGIKTNLDPGTLIFSDKLKMGGKTFAKLNKPNMTSKEDKILEDNKSSAMSKLTANLMKQAKNKSSIELFEAQEALKQSKLDSYTKRLGGMMKYPLGGIFTPEQYKQAQTDSMTLYNSGRNHGNTPNWQVSPDVNDAAGRLHKLNGTSPVSNHGVYNTSNPYVFDNNVQFQKPTMIPYKDPQIVDQQVKPVNHPIYNQYVPGIDRSKQTVITQQFRGGGKYKPSFDTKMVDESQDENVVVPEYDPTNSFSYEEPVTMRQTTKKELIDRRNDRLNNGIDEPIQSSGNKPNWKDIGTQAAYFAANNASNIYDLSRANKVETTKYDRAKANLLDSSQAKRDGLSQTRRAEENVKNASGGNAATYLATRVGLNAQNTENMARIDQNYANANAGILNQNSQFNSQVQMRENDANEMNRAAQRSSKQAAIARIGSNTANQMNDVRQNKQDKDKVDMLIKQYPILESDPELLKLYMKYK